MTFSAEEAVKNFFALHPEIAKLEWDGDEVTIWFINLSSLPLTYKEFTHATGMRYDLLELDEAFEQNNPPSAAWVAKPFGPTERLSKTDDIYLRKLLMKLSGGGAHGKPEED